MSTTKRKGNSIDEPQYEGNITPLATDPVPWTHNEGLIITLARYLAYTTRGRGGRLRMVIIIVKFSVELNWINCAISAEMMLLTNLLRMRPPGGWCRRWRFGVVRELTGWLGLTRLIRWINCYRNFSLLALDSNAALGMAIPVNPTAKHTAINTYAGVALDPNSWERTFDRVRLASRPLFNQMYAISNGLRINGHIGIIYPWDQSTSKLNNTSIRNKSSIKQYEYNNGIIAIAQYGNNRNMCITIAMKQ